MNIDKSELICRISTIFIWLHLPFSAILSALSKYTLRFVRVCLCRYLRVRIPSDCVVLTYRNMHFASADTILPSSVLGDTISVFITFNAVAYPTLFPSVSVCPTTLERDSEELSSFKVLCNITYV